MKYETGQLYRVCKDFNCECIQIMKGKELESKHTLHQDDYIHLDREVEPGKFMIYPSVGSIRTYITSDQLSKYCENIKEDEREEE